MGKKRDADTAYMNMVYYRKKKNMYREHGVVHRDDMNISSNVIIPNREVLVLLSQQSSKLQVTRVGEIIGARKQYHDGCASSVLTQKEKCINEGRIAILYCLLSFTKSTLCAPRKNTKFIWIRSDSFYRILPLLLSTSPVHTNRVTRL